MSFEARIEARGEAGVSDSRSGKHLFSVSFCSGLSSSIKSTRAEASSKSTCVHG